MKYSIYLEYSKEICLIEGSSEKQRGTKDPWHWVPAWTPQDLELPLPTRMDAPLSGGPMAKKKKQEFKMVECHKGATNG